VASPLMWLHTHLVLYQKVKFKLDHYRSNRSA
jgi:hypothetical protein